MKTEVYSWRLSAEKKLALESEAIREGKSVSQILDDISSQWLEEKQLSKSEDAAEQEKLRKRVLALAGSLAGGDAQRSSNASMRVKEILAKRYGRRSR